VLPTIRADKSEVFEELNCKVPPEKVMAPPPLRALACPKASVPSIITVEPE
jgi:hypothetical protein